MYTTQWAKLIQKSVIFFGAKIQMKTDKNSYSQKMAVKGFWRENSNVTHFVLFSPTV